LEVWKSAAPALSEGSKAISEMIDRGQKLSGITSESADKADELNDNFADLKGSVGGLSTQFANSLVPSLNDTVKAMNAAIEKGNILESVIRGIAGIGKIPFDLMISDIDMTVGAQIKELDQQLATLGRRRREGENGGLLNQWLYGSTEELDKKIEITRNQLDALKKYGDRLTKPVAASSGVQSPKEKDIKGFLGGDEKGATKSPKKAKEVQEASAEAIAYEKSMQALADITRDADAATMDLSKSQKTIYDLMVSSKWKDMPDTWKQTAIAQASTAIAGEKAADAAKRLSTMLGETDSSKIEKARDDMLLLVGALKAGKISEEQYVEAASKRLDTNTEKLKEQKTVAEELGLTFTSAFEDAVVGGEKFSTVLKSIGHDIAKMILRKNVTEPLANAVGSINWSKLFTQNANGGVYDSPSLSAFSGGVYNSPQLFKFAAGAGVFGEAGPEAIMPLKRGPDGKLGVSGGGGSSVNIVVHNEAGGDGYQASATAKQNGSGIDINVIVTKAIQNDMKRNGPITQGFSQMFGMNRSAA
jgi:antitoxin component of RelBE/YafQ-DinJ toxin-antitoxin module